MFLDQSYGRWWNSKHESWLMQSCIVQLGSFVSLIKTDLRFCIRSFICVHAHMCVAARPWLADAGGYQCWWSAGPRHLHRSPTDISVSQHQGTSSQFQMQGAKGKEMLHGTCRWGGGGGCWGSSFFSFSFFFLRHCEIQIMQVISNSFFSACI